MPVTLSQIAGNIASITLKIQSGDTYNDFTVEYYPGKVTEETFSHLQAFDQINEGSIIKGFGSLNEVLSTLIKSWDLYEDNEQTIMYPITPDALKKLPIAFRINILQGIMSDIRPEAMMPQN